MKSAFYVLYGRWRQLFLVGVFTRLLVKVSIVWYFSSFISSNWLRTCLGCKLLSPTISYARNGLGQENFYFVFLLERRQLFGECGLCFAPKRRDKPHIQGNSNFHEKESIRFAIVVGGMGMIYLAATLCGFFGVYLSEFKFCLFVTVSTFWSSYLGLFIMI